MHKKILKPLQTVVITLALLTPPSHVYGVHGHPIHIKRSKEEQRKHDEFCNTLCCPLCSLPSCYVSESACDECGKDTCPSIPCDSRHCPGILDISFFLVTAPFWLPVRFFYKCFEDNCVETQKTGVRFQAGSYPSSISDDREEFRRPLSTAATMEDERY